MRQEEAEQEAARRNVEDERRERFVFYALDHSAGLGDDAWEVEMRLRTADDGPKPEAMPVAAVAPATPAAQELAAVEPPSPVEPELLEPVPDRPLEASEALPPEAWEPEPDVAPTPRRRRLRRPRLIQLWAAFVILVGLAFVGATLTLSVVLRDYTHFGVLPTSIGIGLGLMAIGIGVALARTE
jgi:hypothetical protein